ncbi:MAG: cytochrome c [Candidatus Acidiferrales bacterium]
MKSHFAGILVTGLAVLGVAITLHSAPAGDATAGKDIFTKKCKTCHGADGDGNPGMAKILNVTFTPLSSEEVQKMSDDDIKKIITDGKGKMKPVKDLTDGDKDNVIAFVRTLKK